NPGTGPLEKAANPLLEGWQTALRGTLGVVRHVVRGGDYPGLAELIGEFYASVAGGGPSPVSPDHLQRVTAVYEDLAANVGSAAQPAAARDVRRRLGRGARGGGHVRWLRRSPTQHHRRDAPRVGGHARRRRRAARVREQPVGVTPTAHAVGAPG